LAIQPILKSCSSDTAMTMRIVALLATLCTAGATELTKETWDAAVAGKQVFVKFLAPW